MDTNKQNAIKKLLDLTDKQFKELQDKVLDDWANNLINTKYTTKKSIDEIVVEINET